MQTSSSHCTETRNVLLWWTGVHRSGSGLELEWDRDVCLQPCSMCSWSLLWESWGHWMERSPTMQRWQWSYGMWMIPPCYHLFSENWRLSLRNCRWPAGDGVWRWMVQSVKFYRERLDSWLLITLKWKRWTSLCFLGSVVLGTSDDIARRVALASSAFGRLRESVWRRGDVSQRLKMRLFKALIVPIAIYGAEIWTLKAKDSRRLEVFEMRCLRAIRGVKLRDWLRNDDIREQLGAMPTITEVIRERDVSDGLAM